MVLEVSKTATPQAAIGAKCDAKCYDYSKSGARPKTTSSMAAQPSWKSAAQQTSSSSIGKSASASGQQKKDSKYGAWGPVFKNKENFVNMHMF